MLSSEFDKTLNKEKFFKNTPPSKSLIIEQQEVNKPLHQLKKLLLRTGQSYDCKDKELTQQLSFIYRLFENPDKQLGKLNNDQKKSVVETEDINKCTSGFRIRVNYIPNDQQAPQHLDELLYLVRKTLIEKITADQIRPYRFKKRDHIYVLNHVYQLIGSDLGIKASSENDPYPPHLKKEIAKLNLSSHTLQNQIAKQYTALKIPTLLTEELQKLLVGYYGPEKNGYSADVAEKIAAFIRPLLTATAIQNADWRVFFIVNQLGGVGISSRIYDIKWSFIQQLFFQKLKEDNYFTQKPKPTDLLDCARLQKLSPDHITDVDLNIFIENYFTEKNYVGLLEQLQLVENQFPIFWKKLITNPDLIKSIKQSIANNASSSELIELNSLVEVMSKVNSHETISFSKVIDNYLKNVFTEKVDINFLNYLIHYQPDKIEFFFQKFLKKNTKPEDINALQELLLNFNKKGSSFLCFAGRYQPKIMKIVLAHINKNFFSYDSEKILKLFLNQNNDGWNLLSVVVLNQPAYLKHVRKFINQHSELFRNEILNLFLTKERHGSLLHIVASSSQPKLLKDLFALINQFKNFDEAILKKLFISENSDGQNLLIACCYQPDNIKTILNFIADHINLFDKTTLEKLFLENKESTNTVPSLLDILSHDLEKKSIDKPTQSFKKFGSGFFKPSYSNAEKKIAAGKFKKLLENGFPDLNTLRRLKKSDPAIAVDPLKQFYTIVKACSSNMSEPKSTISNEARTHAIRN